jgi:hypothetical protein
LTFFIAANLHKAGGTSYMGKARALVSKAEDKVPKRKPETTPDVGSSKPHTKHKHRKTRRFINDCTEKENSITLSFFTFSRNKEFRKTQREIRQQT